MSKFTKPPSKVLWKAFPEQFSLLQLQTGFKFKTILKIVLCPHKPLVHTVYCITLALYAHI